MICNDSYTNIPAHANRSVSANPRDIIADMKRIAASLPMPAPNPFAILWPKVDFLAPEPRRPKMTVSPRLAELMPSEWVAEQNRWMLKFFGYAEPVLKNRQVLLMAERFLYMNEVTHNSLSNIMKVSSL